VTGNFPSLVTGSTSDCILVTDILPVTDEQNVHVTNKGFCSSEKPSGGTSPLRQGAGTETPVPPDLGFAMAAALEGFAYRGLFRKGFRRRGFI
jgi:hypothetical protein